MLVTIPVSPGELIDKITILEIKSERIANAKQQANVERELTALVSACADAITIDDEIALLKQQLRAINERLWSIEDDIRICESRQQFDDHFVQLARAVYQSNDKRAALKRQINEQLGATFKEEKQYA